MIPKIKSVSTMEKITTRILSQQVFLYTVSRRLRNRAALLQHT
jgi:hypothetical protein